MLWCGVDLALHLPAGQQVRYGVGRMSFPNESRKGTSCVNYYKIKKLQNPEKDD